jgi:2,4-dienoyl-CoA reductase-like NADH-dependent reductase (Old Yellow Enzyme family)
MFIEATSVQARGRISPEDAGLWKDSQIEPLRRVVEFAHSQNQTIGIQLAHAGRKASTLPPFLAGGDLADEAAGGWENDVQGPSAIEFSPRMAVPKEMTKEDIEAFKADWAAAVRRAVKAGVDYIEIHNAHGYLLFEFLSPVSNRRTDEYGGSFENRIRLSLEIVDITRQNIPTDMPLFLRISGTEWLEESHPEWESWTLDDTIRFAHILADRGVDFLDVSSGGNHPAQKIGKGPLSNVSDKGTSKFEPSAQYLLSKAVKAAVGDKLAVGVVGGIVNGQMANDMLEDGGLDAALVGRWFQKNPATVWQFAEDLGVETKVANQIGWAFSVRGSTGFLKVPKTAQKL